MFLTWTYAILFYAATAILIFGLARKIYQYAKTPAPLKIPTTPAPTTKGGVVVRMGKELFLFTSLFRSNKWLWILGYLFHVGLLLVLLRHLRYFTEPVPTWVNMIQWIGLYAGFAMVLGLLGLWGRRFLVDRVRYISSPSDHLILALLVGIGVTGLAMDYVSKVDIVGLKSFLLGLMSFNISANPLPTDPILLLHLTLVIVLMVIFPVSKLLHAPGVFFSPTRNQVDNPREKRHVAPWAVVKFDTKQAQ